MDNYFQGPLEEELYIPHEMREQQTTGNETDIKKIANQLMNYHILAHLNDGSQQEGILDEVNDKGVVLLIPEDINDTDRQFYGPRRFRRYNRFLFPFSLFAFPFIVPFPFFY
ncbi:MAG: hypothetical protein ACE3JK_05435 [Sporolactobacillus sp.]